MDALELLTRHGHVDPADEPVIDAAAMAVLDAPDIDHTSRRRSGWPRRTMVGAAAAAAVALAVAGVSLATGNGTSPAPASRAAGSPPPMALHVGDSGGHTILVRLASAVLASPAPAGNATLIIRSEGSPSQAASGGAPITGADLYTDSGQYYFAATESGLPAQVNAGNDQGDGVFSREVAAAEQAASGNLASAAQALEDAADPAVTFPAGSQLADSWLWENSLDALIAGAGNPTVRAGVMRLLATLPEVKVTTVAADGKPAVQLTATFPPTSKCASSGLNPGATDPSLQQACASLTGTGSQEQLTIDATTGIPISFLGGAAGQPPAAEITYQVSRVTLSNIAAGKF